MRTARMPKRAAALALLALLALPAARARAWNEHGHMVIAKVAYQQLTDGQKLKVAALLRPHPHYKSYLLQGRPPAVAAPEWAFLRASTWPDHVRPDREGKKPKDVTKYHVGEWHYINLPFVDARQVRAADRDRLREEKLGPKGPTILDGLGHARATLRSADATPPQKAVALCWLLHLVGDIH